MHYVAWETLNTVISGSRSEAGENLWPGMQRVVIIPYRLFGKTLIMDY